METPALPAVSVEIEDAIRFALVCIEKQALLMDGLVAKADATGHHKSALAFNDQAKLYRQHATTIRLALDGWSGASGPSFAS